MSDQTLKQWRERIAAEAHKKPRRDRHRTRMELMMLAATVLSALATGYGAWFSSKQYIATVDQLETARAQLTAADRNLAFQNALEALNAACKVVRQLDIDYYFFPTYRDVPPVVDPDDRFLARERAAEWFDKRQALAASTEKAEVFRDKFKIYALWAPVRYRDKVINAADHVADKFIRILGERDPERFLRKHAENVELCKVMPNQLITWFQTDKEPAGNRARFHVISQQEIDDIKDKWAKSLPPMQD
ncbi:hypothetical protein [Shinella sp.]|uniref:hypothetical protein n=1 Tax=Shinella sp. TaxID=1870904 RepID=UPI0028AC8E9D|nr:hypothetical protein [Shinella sp.]